MGREVGGKGREGNETGTQGCWISISKILIQFGIVIMMMFSLYGNTCLTLYACLFLHLLPFFCNFDDMKVKNY